MTEKDETSHSDACKQEAHYWILNDKSFGICKKCGAQKQFPMIGVFGWHCCQSAKVGHFVTEHIGVVTRVEEAP